MRLYDGRSGFYQYDTNQKLICESCQVGEEVHFSNNFYSKAAICKTYELEGSVVVDVPNMYLLNSGELIVYRMCVDSEGRSTIEKYTFPVLVRKKPSDYVYTETEVMSYHALEQRINKLEESGGVNVTGAKVDQIIKIAAVDDNGKPTAWTPFNMPTKLSDFENDLYYVKREPVVTLTPEDFTDGIYRGTPKLDWFTSADKLGYEFTFINPENGELEVVTEVDLENMFEPIGVNAMLNTELFGLCTGFNPFEDELVLEDAFYIMTDPSIVEALSSLVIYRIDSKKVPIEYCDTSEIETEIDAINREVV